MRENKADIIFHPVRIRIVQALFGDRKLTAHQMVEVLGGPSIATLYRHLDRLVQAGVVTVVEERPIRGAIEKVYALANKQAARFSPEEAQEVSPEDRMRHFSTLLGTLQTDFGRFLHHKPESTEESHTIIRQDALYVTEAEARELGSALKAVLSPYLQNRPDDVRHRYLLTTLLLPIIESAAPDEEPIPEENV